jgi:prepilin-type N-terminal cleavage/methylation domain-containing protein
MSTRNRGGFTVIEVSIVLALIVVMMALVIVRFDWGSQRQKAIMEARKLGNLITTYREKARDDEQIYALRLDSDTGNYAVVHPLEKSAASALSAPSLRAGRLENLRFKRIAVDGRKLQSPVVIFFSVTGVLPRLSIDIGTDAGTAVGVDIDPLVSEVSYAEK